MTHRKLIRPDADPAGASRSLRRKQAPPEQTNAEEYYYTKQMSAKTPMVVVLTNDEELRGWIEWYDKGSLKLNRGDGPNLLIPKHNIRYMFKEEELRRQRRRARPARGAKPEAEGEEAAPERPAVSAAEAEPAAE